MILLDGGCERNGPMNIEFTSFGFESTYHPAKRGTRLPSKGVMVDYCAHESRIAPPVKGHKSPWTG